VKSKVTERLAEAAAPEVVEYLYLPRLREEFGSSFAHMTAVNRAHVLMLAKQRIISLPAARKILRALAALERRGVRGFRLDPQLEDTYFNYEAAVIKLTGTDIGGQMHTARSRNDLGATITRLMIRDTLLEYVPLLFQARRTALAQARRYASIVMPGYTHLQPAQPLTFGHYLVGIAAALERDTRRIAGAYESANRSALGACALAGTTFPIDRALPARLLGFDGIVEHTLDAVASRDFALELLAGWAIFGLTCSRLAQDCYIWFTHEFGSVDFPDRVAGTSSIMPQKKNPVVLEHLKGKPAHLLAAFVSMAAAVKMTNFTNTVDGNRESTHWLWHARDEARACAVLLNLVLATARPNAALLEARARADFSTATDLADLLVRSGRMSFREAHHVVGGVVREAIAAGLRADQIGGDLVDRVARRVVGRPARLDAGALRRALDPRRSVEGRAHPGGPAPREVRRMIREAERRLRAEERAHAVRAARVDKAAAALRDAVRALLRGR